MVHKPVLPKGHNLKNAGREPLDDVTCVFQIWNVLCIVFWDMNIFNIAIFKHFSDHIKYYKRTTMQPTTQESTQGLFLWSLVKIQ